NHLTHLEIKGLWSHFSTAENENLTYANLQSDRFSRVVECAHKLGVDPQIVHLANSGAFLQMGETVFYDMVRIGILLYGYPPSPHLTNNLPIQPIMTLKSRVVYVKKPPAGTKIGYGATWESPGEHWIATVPIGYGDGYPRRAGNRGWVYLRGRKCPIVGKVSMDQITIDAGQEAYLGDEVLLFGQTSQGNLDLWDLCQVIDATPYEILCGLTSRVERIYIPKAKTATSYQLESAK
ncbi:MAG: alanine racemase, partial [bacterium]